MGSLWRWWKRWCSPLRQRRGRKGEDEAARYLESRGLRILERNVRFPFGELDLVAEEREAVVFVEVKTRSSSAWGRPARAVNRTKRWRLSRAADAYLRRHPRLRQRPCRFDVVEVYLDERERVQRVEWIRSAFEHLRR